MRPLFTLFLSSIFVVNIYSQSTPEILAKIGSKVITADEFKYRFELTPQIDRKYSNDLESKKELLYTLISEKLFALQGEEMGFDTISVMKNTFGPLKSMYMRDALYQKEIKDSVKFNNQKFTEGMKLASNKLFVDYLYSKDETIIKKTYRELLAAQNFDSLAPLLKEVEYVKEPYEVIYGKMFPDPEKEVYALKIGQFTKPQKSPDGWYIFRLLSKNPVTYTNTQEKVSKVRKVVEGRIEDSIYNNFWLDFFKNKNVNTSGTLFWYLAENIKSIIVNVKEKLQIADGEKITLANEDFINLKNKMNPDSLKKDFIEFDNNPVTLEKFINDFMFEGFYTFATDLKTIAAQLKSRVRRQIELELLTRFADEKGIESLPEVKSSTEIWRDNYLATLYKKNFLVKSKISDSDIRKFLKNNNDNLLDETRYKVIEVLTDSLDVVKQALQIANDNVLFRNFAKEHSKREEAKNNGEIGYFTISNFEEIGKVVETMNIGDIFGPLQTADGYSVFKLIDKKEGSYSYKDSVLTDQMRKEIQYRKIYNDLENKTAELANNYKVTINEDLLKSLKVLNAQMIVFRHMGFGGRILAVPYTSPFYKWKDKWEQKKKDLL